MRILTYYEKTVLEALKNGPKPRNVLFKELCPKTMSIKKLQTTLNELEDEGRIICRPRRIGESHKWTSVYALPKHRHLLEADYSQIARAVKYLRLELCRNPEVEEVAAEIGEVPESVRKLLFKHASELRWKPPTPEEREEAKKLREEARKLAAKIKYSLDDEIILSEISMEDIKRAEFLLENQLKSIKTEDIGAGGVLLGPGFPLPPSPKERSRKEIIEAIKKLRNLKKGEP
jgi:DNA-binding HxlR family transcriptional regulator